MSTDALKLEEVEQDRQQILNEAAEDNAPNWSDQFQPGSFGCHELLDRTALVSDLLRRCSTHPACADPNWFAACGLDQVAATTGYASCTSRASANKP